MARMIRPIKQTSETIEPGQRYGRRNDRPSQVAMTTRPFVPAKTNAQTAKTTARIFPINPANKLMAEALPKFNSA
jgi:hypothetical protein